MADSYQVNEWANFGDVSPEHGQVWIKCADVDSKQDYAECVEILSGSDIGLADNQYRIQRGSIYIPLHDSDAIARALSYIDKTPSLATWVDKAIACHAYYGIELDTYCGFEIVQIGKTLDDWNASGTTCDDPDTLLHGNASIEKCLAENYLA